MKYKKNRPKPIIIITKTKFKKAYVPPAPTTKNFPEFPKWPVM